ncbi:MAG TPA: glycine cleavage system aminomethyltransferase GcvT [Terriglobia bacterium]|nr:glycine cleavage system aminomethyltransferase GcvT [Terriglobia bacterium]
MATATGIALKRTALNAVHHGLGARMVDFAGWEMPVEYSGIIEEHVAVRTRAGLFDVSHMGEIDIRGPGALALVQHVTSNDASRLKINQAQYTALMYPQGSAVDDCLVHRFADDHFFLCVNASNTDLDFAWIIEHNRFGATVRNVSSEYSQLALQGPKAPAILAKVSGADLVALKYYWFTEATCAGVKVLLARTGYTGEDGFELYFAPEPSKHVWQALLEAGKDEGLIPVGLGARNTLRLEAAYPLYGHELDQETTLMEAGLAWITKLEKGEFLGRDVLADQKLAGTRKRLIGFEMTDRNIARDGYPVWVGEQKVGQVTSGSPAPFLKKNIGLAYIARSAVDRRLAEPGRTIEIEIRSRRAPARVVPLPFYKRPK